ncbi:hypothetical protein KM043_007043 [Ampulex compressa]|nr:hypothetical protein KM043_007043 [Ampulex compressa]
MRFHDSRPESPSTCQTSNDFSAPKSHPGRGLEHSAARGIAEAKKAAGGSIRRFFGVPIVYEPSPSRPLAIPAYNAPWLDEGTYYDPSFCPFAARNKHLLRHRVKWEEGWRGAIDVDCRGTISSPFTTSSFHRRRI